MEDRNSTHCLFACDLHGRTRRYEKLFEAVRDETPGAVFLGGDLMPHGLMPASDGGHEHRDFLHDFLVPRFTRLMKELGRRYPRVFLILGNDDGRAWEGDFVDASSSGIWEYAHNKRIDFGSYRVYGYSYVSPTPFLLKDWEKYDVSRYVDPGCVSPEEGFRTVPIPDNEKKYSLIKEDLEGLAGGDILGNAVFLFHTPPHRTLLDRAALDGKMVDHVPLDVHVGSIAVRRFIEARQPLLTLHGHIHESSGITGFWRDKIGRTAMFSAAWHGPELALVSFDLEKLEEADRWLM